MQKLNLIIIALIINKKNIIFSRNQTLNNIKWKKFDVDYVFECTGKFNSKDKLLAHIKMEQKKLLFQHPVKMQTKLLFMV